jgi:hypothetical protein
MSLFQKQAINLYFADCLRSISENTAKQVQGSYVQTRLIDLLNPKPQKTETKEEIIEKIRKKL